MMKKILKVIEYIAEGLLVILLMVNIITIVKANIYPDKLMLVI